MTNTIIVYPELFEFYLASEEGWYAQLGHKVHVNGYDFAFTASEMLFGRAVITVSELKTGCKLRDLILSINETELSETKAGTLSVFANKAKEVAELINKHGEEAINKAIADGYRIAVEKCGEKPETEVYEE